MLIEEKSGGVGQWVATCIFGAVAGFGLAVAMWLLGNVGDCTEQEAQLIEYEVFIDSLPSEDADCRGKGTPSCVMGPIESLGMMCATWVEHGPDMVKTYCVPIQSLRPERPRLPYPSMPAPVDPTLEKT